MNTIPHGTYSAYKNHGCRCDECKAANASRTQDFRAMRRAKPKDPTDPRHGKATFYDNHGCRCQLCTEAWAEAARQKRKETQ